MQQDGVELRPGAASSAAVIVEVSAAPVLPRKSEPDRSFLISAVGNLSVQYNLSCLAIAVACLTTPPVPGGEPFVVEPEWAKLALMGIAFAGAAAGMVIMGWVGDRIGRRRGMIATLAFVVAGALGPALFAWGEANTFFFIICVSRVFLGFGLGGVYPMAAATAHEGEGHAEADAGAAAVRVAWAFFWQAPGAALPYLLAVCLTASVPSDSAGAAFAHFRLIVGFGAVVAAVPLVAACYAREAVAPKEDPPPRTLKKSQGLYASVSTDAPVDIVSAPNPLSPGAEAGFQSPWLTFVGTGGAWFLYDVVLYGTTIFTPQILESIFGASDSVYGLAKESLFVSFLGVPACAMAVYALKHRGGRWLSIWGFVFIAAAFASLATALTLYPDSSQATGAKFTLFCAITVALNAGPNVSTYVLPASAFRRSERGTFHGLSAAAGKLGAVVGAFAFPPLVEGVGLAGVMWMQVGVALLGAAASVFFLRPSNR